MELEEGFRHFESSGGQSQSLGQHPKPLTASAPTQALSLQGEEADGSQSAQGTVSFLKNYLFIYFFRSGHRNEADVDRTLGWGHLGYWQFAMKTGGKECLQVDWPGFSEYRLCSEYWSLVLRLCACHTTGPTTELNLQASSSSCSPAGL